MTDIGPSAIAMPMLRARPGLVVVSLISTVSRALYYWYLIVQYLVPGNRSYTNVCRANKPIFLAREGPGTIFLAWVGFPLCTW